MGLRVLKKNVWAIWPKQDLEQRRDRIKMELQKEHVSHLAVVCTGDTTGMKITMIRMNEHSLRAGEGPGMF